MSSITKRAELFQKSARRVKDAENYDFIELIQVICKLYNDYDSKVVVEHIIKNYKDNAAFRENQTHIDIEKTYADMLGSLLNKYSVKDAIQAIDMWNIIQSNMSFFQSHVCWVNNKKVMYLKNTRSSSYITWVKEGKTFPILRRFFENYYGFNRSFYNEQQMYALIDILRNHDIGLEMSKRELDAKIVLEILKGKITP
ncbi:hypothetical protein [Dendrosporobacter sp. 1207_IL3150]|uniref:hypothetical protein n=1 Tax=Dendrosporobacter sp. 1207_IL3150 TaxID=3084054 RepID=UPI002FD93450